MHVFYVEYIALGDFHATFFICFTDQPYRLGRVG